jgi:lipoate-protein ligase B
MPTRPTPIERTAVPPRSPWRLVDLGRVPYEEAWSLQLRLVEARASGRLETDVALALEHPPVFTLGKRGGRDNLLVPQERLERSGIAVVQVERGGNITYHGPGQLVVYPIVALESAGIGVVDMVERLEEVMIRVCGEWGIAAGRNPANRGVWVGDKKIGAIGIAVRRGVSFHGMALNVNTDLAPFSWIQPCGLAGVGVSSMQAETGAELPLSSVHRALSRHLQAVFVTRVEPADRGWLLRCLDGCATETPCRDNAAGEST